jgi:hypothetical protein
MLLWLVFYTQFCVFKTLCQNSNEEKNSVENFVGIRQSLYSENDVSTQKQYGDCTAKTSVFLLR